MKYVMAAGLTVMCQIGVAHAEDLKTAYVNGCMAEGESPVVCDCAYGVAERTLDPDVIRIAIALNTGDVAKAQGLAVSAGYSGAEDPELIADVMGFARAVEAQCLP